METKSQTPSTGTSLAQVIRALEQVAPSALAEEWDNTGLLLGDPSREGVRRVLLTIDLTPAVRDETLASEADVVVAYHPPWFAPAQQLVADRGAGSVLWPLATRDIAVYSPHTALDNAPGGVNDWLAEAFPGSAVTGLRAHNSAPDTMVGRLVTLPAATETDQVLQAIRSHLGVSLRVAGQRDRIQRIALCAGAGASVLQGTNADLFWTGEMRHHDVLAAVADGRMVALSEHTHTERGYLPRLAERLAAALPEVEWQISTTDQDPLSPWPPLER